MPEGPEVRRQADKIQRALRGHPLSEVEFAFPQLKRYGRQLEGQRISEVESRGKAFLIHFPAPGLAIYVHLQLYGRWYVQTAGKWPRTNRSLRLALKNEKKWALLYSASEIEVLERGQVDAHPFLARIGPDILKRGLTARAIQRRLESKTFRRRTLGALYLDQGFLAGLGNYLRSEILYRAGIDPRRKPQDLHPDDVALLARETLEVARQSYKTGGITNDLERVAELKAEGRSRRFYRHHVFARENKPCWACSTPIERHELAGRRAYVCRTCQPYRG